jgi:hypothetical protein
LPLGAPEDTTSRSRRIADVLALVVAAALVFSALFPYVFVGKPPRFSGLWETRHQTTLMMVSGFVIWAVLRLVIARRFLSRIAAILAAGFLLIDISITQRLVADGLELRALSNYFKANPAPPGTMMFVVEDDRDYRTLRRFLPFYELAFLINTDRPGNPTLPFSNRDVIDPSTKTYAVKATVPAVMARRCAESARNTALRRNMASAVSCRTGRSRRSGSSPISRPPVPFRRSAWPFARRAPVRPARSLRRWSGSSAKSPPSVAPALVHAARTIEGFIQGLTGISVLLYLRSGQCYWRTLPLPIPLRLPVTGRKSSQPLEPATRKSRWRLTETTKTAASSSPAAQASSDPT